MSKERTQTIIGVDIGSHSIKMCAVLHSDSQDTIPRILDIVEAETDSIHKGDIIDEQSLLKDLEKTITKFDPKVFTKNGQTFVIALNTYGINSLTNSGHILINNLNKEVSATDLDRVEKEASTAVAMIKNKKIIYINPLRYKLDQVEVQGNPIGMFGKKIEGKFLFAYSPINYIEKIENVFLGLGIKNESYEVGGIAESIPLLNRKQRIAGTALINLGHSTTSIIVFENNRPTFISVIDVGSDNITKDIALLLQVDLEQAEKIKISHDEFSYSKRKLEDIIEARVQYICERINQELEKINRKELLPGGVILSGGGSKLLGIEDLFKKYLKLPVRLADIEIANFSENQLKDSTYAKAYGLTFLVDNFDSTHQINQLFKKTLKNISNLFRKLIP